jgi:hypothetical protein
VNGHGASAKGFFFVTLYFGKLLTLGEDPFSPTSPPNQFHRFEFTTISHYLQLSHASIRVNNVAFSMNNYVFEV